MAMKNGSFTDRTSVSSHFDKEGSYWLSKLSGDLVKSCFPYDYPEKAAGEMGMAPGRKQVTGSITGELFQELMKLSGGSDAKLHIILVTGLMTLLNRYTGNTDIIVGTPIYKPEQEGQYINTVLALRNRVERRMSFKDLLVEARKTVIEAVEHANFPVNTLLYQLGLPVSSHDFPLFDIAILLENIQDKQHIEHIRPRMIFSCKRTRQGLEVTVEYTASLYEKDTLERILSHFIHLMRHTLGDIDGMISGIHLLSGSERERLLMDLNRTDTEYPKDKTIHRLFQEQAETAPDHTVIIHGDNHFTYKELNSKSNQLARILRKKGVGRDTLVGLMIERSFDMMMGILAVLKAGGGYIPIDPETPKERIIVILRECRTSFLLTGFRILDNQPLPALQALEFTPVEPHVTGKRPQIKDLDNNLPFPDRSLVNYEKYSGNIGITMATHTFLIQGSRGCPYNCAFCHKIWPKTHIFRSAENLFEEVKLYYDMGVRRFALIDDIFNLDKKHSSAFFRMLLDNKMKVQIFFPNGIRTDILTKEYIDLMVEAGTINLACALETASPRIQKMIGKNLILDKFRENVEYFAEKYPHVIMDLFTMQGFPSETEEEVLKTLAFIKSVRWFHFPAIATVRIYPNTDMEKLALQHGITRESIERSMNLAFHQLPETLPFDKQFMLEYQTDYLYNYFLNKERLMHVLPYQMKALTEKEMVQKYGTYLPVKIKRMTDVLDIAGISREEFGKIEFFDESAVSTAGIYDKMLRHFPRKESDADALRILLVDVSTSLPDAGDRLNIMLDIPLGLVYLMTYLKRQFGSKINGKISKSMIDFTSYTELRRSYREFKPDVIGLRALTFHKRLFHRVVSMFRQWGFEGAMIAGGPYATSSYNDILQDRNVDVVVLGEGEVTFTELIGRMLVNDKKLPAEEVLKEIKGISFLPGKIGGRNKIAQEVIMVDGFGDALDEEPAQNLEDAGDPTDLAYCMFTSGSTGRPKGVMIQHRGVVNYLWWASRHYLKQSHASPQPGAIFPLYSSVSFDMTVTSLLGPVIGGNIIDIYSGEYNEVLIEKVIEKNRARVLKLTPSHLKLIKSKMLEGGQESSNIRTLILGGEELETRLAAEARENFGEHVEIYNEYGPTETVVGCMIYRYDPAADSGKSVPIGIPIANTRVYLLNGDRQPVPVGVAGELYISGDGVARGYVNSPEITREKFVKNPLLRGTRMYRSGDLARWKPDGNMEFLGRIDHQVKVRGFRIELGEIESRLLTHEKVKDAVVIARDDESDSTYLCAYVVPAAALPGSAQAGPGETWESFDPSVLKDYLSRILPDYMIPPYIMEINEIPLTASGKLDRKALPEPEFSATEKYVAPRDELEEKLVDIWSEVLGAEKSVIGIDANFFEMGGHSLKATFLVSRIHKALNVKLTLVEIFREPTIRAIAEIIRKAAKREFIAIEPAPEKAYYVQSSAQKRLFILQQIDIDSTVYNLPQVYPLAEDMDLEKLEETFRKLIQRHESLRTSFEFIDEGAVQKVHEEVELVIQYADFAHEGAMANFIHPFDLSQAPLLRVRVIRKDSRPYLLMVDLHHIISDGVSHNVLMKDFHSLYNGETLPELGLQYKDYAEWQQGETQQKEIMRQKAYWLSVFAGESEVPVLDLPYDYPRPQVQSFEGNFLLFGVGKEAAGALLDTAMKVECTLFMALMAVFNILLAKLSGQEEIIVGNITAGRRHADLEKTIGMFVNTIALWNSPAPRKTFNQFLRDVKERTLSAFENQEYPFEELMEQLSESVTRDISRNPLFDVVFFMQNQNDQDIVPVLDESLVDGIAENELTDYRVAKFDMTLTASEVEDRLLCRFEYCTKLFKKRTIERYIRYFKKIISIVAANPGIKIADIEIITAEEKRQILQDFNDTASGYPEDKTIHELFAEQVKKRPDAVAAVGREEIVGAQPFAGIQLTYRELDEKSDRLAYRLLEKGVGPGSIVGIMVERSIEMIVGIFGTLKAGGAYLPIEPDYPRERVNYILRDSNAGTFLSARAVRVKVDPNRPLEMIDISAGLSSSTSTSTCRISPANPAYIIYTSGSTGKPKGVIVEHRSIMNTLFALHEMYPFLDTDVYMLKTSYVFDVSIAELFGWFFGGGRLAVLEKGAEKDPAGILHTVEKERVTHVNFVPSMFNAFVEYLEGLGQASPGLGSLRYVFLAGEAILPEPVQVFRRMYPGIKQENIYGPTEASIYGSKYSLQDWQEGESIPIGTPLPNVSLYILDKYNQLQPIGVPGELCICGAGLARGYLNRPELTEEKFFSDRPSSLHFSKKIYRTGDLACWREDGNIEFLGRIDHQIKIRGFRVELGEIESRLTTHEKIKEAAVLLKKAIEGEPSLCAYFVSDQDVELVELKEYLALELPGYMVPSYFVKLEKMPLNTTGKIDREALSEMQGIYLETPVTYVAPRNSLEKMMVEIWEAVIGRKNIGIHDKFFMLGGDSIKSIQIATRMKKLGYEVGIKDLFLHPTIAELAPLLKKVEKIADQSVISGQVPLTAIQEAFFMSEKQVPTHYNQAVLLYSRQYLEDEAVRTVFSTIQAHHDALRMTFTVDENGEIRQINHGLDYPSDFQAFDLRRRDNAVALMESKANDIQASINLDSGPLMKTALFHLDDGDRLLVAVHHLVMDGVSWRILFEDIESLYNQYTNQEELKLPLKTDSFKVWAEQLSRYADSGGFLKEKPYWAALEARTAAVAPIPRDFAEKTGLIKDKETLSFKLSQDETQRLLSTLNKAFTAEIDDILLTALGWALNKTFAVDQVVVALEGHGREPVLPDIDITRTVGWFTSVYPVVLDVSYENDPGRQIKEVKETLRRVPNKGMGYGILKYLTAEAHKRDIVFQSSPGVSFNYLGQFDADTEQMASFQVARESGGRTMSPEETGEYELDVTGILANHCLTMSVVFSPKQYRPETIERLTGHFESQLKTIISYCAHVEKRQLTPGDFTYTGLSIDAVDALTSQVDGEIEDIYTLSSMQEGMLFHALYDADSSAYFEQAAFRLQGELEPAVVQESLNELAKRFDVLRTMFYHEGMSRPIQVVLKDRSLDFYYEDIYRAFETAEAREKYIREFKEKDIKRGFDLSRDPLMRVAILQMDRREYEFIWSHHHILMDGWCLGILIREFLDIYRCSRENEPVHLPAAAKYKTYIQWLEKRDKEESRAYWSGYLRGYEETAAVPCMKEYPPAESESYKNESFDFALGVEKTRGLNRLAGGNQVTLNTVIQAVWGIILGKYTGKQDVVFGAVVSGRPAEVEGVESMVGLFINTIPVRIRREADTPFSHLLRDIQLAAIESEPHHHYPLAEIQAGNPLKHNLLDHVMAFENYPIARQIEGAGEGEDNKNKIDQGAFFRLSGVDTFEHSNYDFNIVVSPGPSLAVKFIYNGNGYNGEFIRKIADHFTLVLDQVLTNDRLAVGALTLLSDEEKQQVLVAFNDTRSDYPSEMTIHKLFAGQARQTPRAVAVRGPSLETGDSASLTYEQLNRKANRLARVLRQRGVTVEGIVGIMVEHSIEMIVGILGILKAGGAYLPVEADLPPGRMTVILGDCNGPVLLTVPRNGQWRGVEAAGEIIFLDQLSRITADESGENPENNNHASHLAYVMFTSGSTGIPKGVMVEHKSVVRLVKNSNFIQFSDGDSILQTGALSFDASTFEIWGALLNGLRLCLVSKETMLNPFELKAALEDNRITTMWMTAPLFNHMLEEDAGMFTGLKNLVVGGDALSPPHINRLRRLAPHVNIINGYGPTENTTFSATFRVEREYGKRIPIGKPIANSFAYIMDEKDRLQPVGVPGELLVGGDGVARGYLNRPELTAERFLVSKKLYRTGDLTRWLPDGNIEFLGRMDHQVKVRGLRIELGEIETRLLKHEAVTEAVVTVRESHAEVNSGDRYLCAYVVLGVSRVSGESLESLKLREYLAEELPGYMIPSYFVPMESLPLTKNGKIDRKALPEPELAEPGEEYAAPRDEIEEKIAALWSEILHMDKSKISIHADFFDLGGHSLLATRMVSMFHKIFHTKVPIAEIFVNSTIAELSRYIREARKERYAPVGVVERKEYYCLSPSQKRMYYLQQIDPSSTFYNIPYLIPWERHLAKEQLEEAFRELFARHESFRTSLEMIDREPVQRIHEQADFEIEYYDSGPVKEVFREFIRPFDLSQAPLIRVGLLKEAEETVTLMVDMHHILSDGVSMEVTIREFTALLEGKTLPALRLQYKDYAEWLNGEEQKEAMKRQEEYWLNRFRGELPVLRLPLDYRRPTTQTFEGHTLFFEIGEAETRGLRELEKSHDVTLFMLLLALYNVLFYKMTGQEDIIMGTAAAGRGHADLQDIVGFFVNTLALRNRPAGDKTFIQFLAELRQDTLEAFENQDYQFDELVQRVAPQKEKSRNPLFDVMVVLENQHAPVDIGDDWNATEEDNAAGLATAMDHRVAHFDLSLVAMETKNKVIGYLEYSTRLFKEETARSFIDYFRRILVEVLEDPGKKIVDIEFLSREEKAELLKRARDQKGELFEVAVKPHGESPEEDDTAVDFDF